MIKSSCVLNLTIILIRYVKTALKLIKVEHYFKDDVAIAIKNP